ncbi:retinol-binding protein pinta [Anabrus simplex]|uniref:retinol-binding protein pinta n=1 Tax=Anabrus simplex TaxID=316456 RepID=UPI0035A391AB
MLDIRPLSKKLQDDAKKNLNEVPERREEDVNHIKEWISKQPHIHARTDDQFLITFLRGCKFSLERTKEKLDAYYTFRTALPEIFRNRDPFLPELQDILNTNMNMMLGTDSEGRYVWLLRMEDIDPSKHTVDNMLKVFFMVFEIIFLEHDETTIYGENVIVDFAKSTLGHLALWTPSVMMKIFAIWQDGYPGRPRGLNYINLPSFFETLINFIRSIIKEKLRKRLHVHPNLESMYKHGMKGVLPKEYGGDNESMDTLRRSLKKKLESYRDYFLDDDKYGVDESRRPGKPKTKGDLFGIEGSFRQLRVD